MSKLRDLRRSAPVAIGLLWALMLATPAMAQSSAAKNELVARIIQLQLPGIESLAQTLVERPAALMLQDASQALSKRLAVDLREDAGKRIQQSANRYVEEAAPLIRARAVKLAPSVLGPELEASFSEAELTELLAWLESPLNRKYQQTLPQMQDNFVQKLVVEARPLIDPMLLKLEREIRGTLGLPPATAKPSPAASAAAPKKR